MTSDSQPHPDLLGLEPEDAKASLRAAILAQRETRSERRRSDAAAGFAIILGAIPDVREARTVALYAARRFEPHTNLALEKLHAAGKQILFPVLGTGLQRQWACFRGLDDLVQRAPGRPPEPSGEALGIDAIAQADAVIVPALAVDTAGSRLGHGGGWYDRALGHVRPGVKVIAMVFPDEVYDATTHPLPQEDHDRPVDGVATPQEWYWLTRPSA